MSGLTNEIKDNLAPLAFLPFGHEARHYDSEEEFIANEFSKQYKWFRSLAFEEMEELITNNHTVDKDFEPSEELKERLMELCEWGYRRRKLNEWKESFQEVLVDLLAGKITIKEAENKVEYPMVTLTKIEGDELLKTYEDYAKDYFSANKWRGWYEANKPKEDSNDF